MIALVAITAYKHCCRHYNSKNESYNSILCFHIIPPFLFCFNISYEKIHDSTIHPIATATGPARIPTNPMLDTPAIDTMTIKTMAIIIIEF